MGVDVPNINFIKASNLKPKKTKTYKPYFVS